MIDVLLTSLAWSLIALALVIAVIVATAQIRLHRIRGKRW